MNLVQATFQASFDARVERLDETQLAELRTIFRYFDTDGDGAVAASQACRMFTLLGLDVDEQQVQALGEVYLEEFIKIVDSHSPAPLLPTSYQRAQPLISDPGVAVMDPQASKEGSDAAGGPEPVRVTREEILQRSRTLWTQEWRLLDTHRRGFVTRQQLTRFLSSCAADLPTADLQRFLESYGESSTGAEVEVEKDDDALLLSEAGFLRFRHDFTVKDLAPSDDRLSSSAVDEGEDDIAALVFDATENQPTDRAEGDSEARQLVRPPSAGPSGRRSDHDALSARHDHLAVDPSVFQESEYGSETDEGESEAHVMDLAAL